MNRRKANTSRGMNTKFWRFTCNNYTQQCLDAFQKVRDNIEYLCYAEEVGAQGTPHLQGYLVFKKKQYLSACRKISKRTDFGPANGTPSQNYLYCRKGEQSKEEWEALKEQGPNYGSNLKGWFEYGVLPADPKGKAKEGSKKGGEVTSQKWDEIWTAAKEGRFDDIPPKIRVNSWRTINAIAQDHQRMPEHLDDVCGIWLMGPPNSGKSHYARHYMGPEGASKLAPETVNYEKLLNKWWDGYNDLKTPYVFIEEIDHTHAPFMGAYLKRWADKWSFSAEHKGTTKCHRPKAILVSSNYSIEEVFRQQGEMMIAAVRRRFKVVRFYGETQDELTGALNENPEHRNKTWFCRFLPEPELAQEEIIEANIIAEEDLHESSHENDFRAAEVDSWVSDSIDSLESYKRRKQDSQEVDESAASRSIGFSESLSEDDINDYSSGDEAFIDNDIVENIGERDRHRRLANDMDVLQEIHDLLGYSSSDV